MSRHTEHSMVLENRTSQPPSVPLLDVGRENENLQMEIQDAIARVCQSGRFVLGPDCRRLEESIAQYCDVQYGIGCASASDALLLALLAIGVGPGDEVIAPSFTFFATASAIWRLGARPVFADIDPATFNMDASCVASLITSTTKAVLPVHLFGQCADMSPICELAERHGLVVIEDAAQAIGAKYQGRPAGSLGNVGCFSFYPTKNLGGWGDGGMLTTSDAEMAKNLRLLRCHGMQPRYFHRVVGINSRLDTIQAAVLNVKLKHVPKWSAQRQAHAARYRELFRAAALEEFVELPTTSAGNDHVWNQFTIRVLDRRRDALRLYLSAAEIGTEIYYPVPLHRQECFQSLGYAEGSLPETERAATEALSLPVFPGLREQEQEAVVYRISEFFLRSTSAAGKSIITPPSLSIDAAPVPHQHNAN